ncbi:MAG: LysR family transcriptional regulator [Clostridiales bacterium]|nr:LysR family transcriptional regulator [Clostridiales bacterium]
MNLETLYAFQKTACLGHLTEAAAQLNISQPALSRSIHALENEIGAPLFDRIGNRIILNENGSVLLKTVNKMLSDYEQTIESIREQNHMENNSIRLCITSAGVHVPELIRGFKQSFPDTIFYICSDLKEFSREYHFMIGYTIGNALPEGAIPLAEEPLYFSVSPDSPFAAKTSIRLADTRDCNFLFTARSNSMYDIQLYYCRKAGFEPDIRMISEKTNIIESLVHIDEGVCLFPKLSLRDEDLYCVQIPVSDMDYRRLIYIQPNRVVYQTNLAKEFEHFCIRFFRNKMETGDET